MKEKIKEYIEESFLKPLLKIKNITDISFNGEDLFYVTNDLGRKKATIKITNKEANDFLRQIANLSDSLFSYASPVLDVSIDKYRINGIHESIARKHREKVANFSIRIGYEGLRINDDSDFLNSKLLKLLKLFIDNKESIVVGGVTGSGKTELQKYLISKFSDSSRVIVIDNLNEIENEFSFKDLDIQTWVIGDVNTNLNFDIAIKNALRSNPDWIILSEARGKEMLNVLNSAMSGHPTITTIHSKDVDSMYSRMTRMCLQNSEYLKYDEVIEDIYDHFKLLIFVKKDILKDGSIKRYIYKVASNYNHKIINLYKYPNTYYQIPKEIFSSFEMSDYAITKFIKEWINE